MEQRENPEKTNAISNCVKQVENAKVRGYEPEASAVWRGQVHRLRS
jgi:hypothetical protein